MLFLALAGLVFLSAMLCFVAKAMNPNSDWDEGGSFFSVVTVIVVMIGFIVSSLAWSSQINDFEDIERYRNVEDIYQTKAEVLTTEFAKYLAENYPEHERDIYDKISPDKVNLYFAKYPELRASETLVILVDRINQLQTDVYDQQISVEQILKNTRFRLRNPWFFTFMIPSE